MADPCCDAPACDIPACDIPARSTPACTVHVQLHVCVTCRAGEVLAEGDAPQGLRFRRALDAALAADEAAGWLRVSEVSCLASCERGCAAVISMPGKWSTLLGHLGTAKVADVITYARSYRASRSGVVLPSKRPASLHNVVLGRVPSLVPRVEEIA